MAKHLDGDRKQLNDGSSPGYLRVWAMLGLVLAAIAFAVWRHLGS